MKSFLSDCGDKSVGSETTVTITKLERFSITKLERFFLLHWSGCISKVCRKTNTKVIAPTNHNGSKQRDEPIRIGKAGKFAPAFKERLLLVLLLIGCKTGARFLSQSLSPAITIA